MVSEIRDDLSKAERWYVLSESGRGGQRRVGDLPLPVHSDLCHSGLFHSQVAQTYPPCPATHGDSGHRLCLSRLLHGTWVPQDREPSRVTSTPISAPPGSSRLPRFVTTTPWENHPHTPLINHPLSSLSAGTGRPGTDVSGSSCTVTAIGGR